MKRIPMLFGFLLFTACAPVKLLPPSQTDIDRIQTKFPGYTLVDLNRGKALFEQNCSICHGLKSPASRSESQWNEIVPRMVRKANKKETMIEKPVEQDILRYLITMCSVP